MTGIIFEKLSFFAAFNTGQPCTPNQRGNSFFGFPHWWKYVKEGEWDGLGNCVPKVSFPEGMWPVAFAVVDMLLYAAGVLAVIFIIIGGLSYMTAEGNPEKAASARRRILNAIIGLAIVILAVPLVSYLGDKIG